MVRKTKAQFVTKTKTTCPTSVDCVFSEESVDKSAVANVPVNQHQAPLHFPVVVLLVPGSRGADMSDSNHIPAFLEETRNEVLSELSERTGHHTPLHRTQNTKTTLNCMGDPIFLKRKVLRMSPLCCEFKFGIVNKASERRIFLNSRFFHYGARF